MRRFGWVIVWALLGGCGGGSAARAPEEISAVWTAGDDEPLPGGEQGSTDPEGPEAASVSASAAQEPTGAPEAP